MKDEAILTYDQRSGALLGLGYEARGYSGFPPYVNDPEAEHIRARGPIPRGDYLVTRSSHTRKGPIACHLQPIGHDAKGRTEFMIHGDSLKAPGYASRGCVVLGRKDREAIWTMTRIYNVILRVV